jgi:hypothetical protein
MSVKRITQSENHITEIMGKQQIMIVEKIKGERPSTYRVSTKYDGSDLKFKIGTIGKIGKTWYCFVRYDEHGPKESIYSTKRECVTYFQTVVDKINERVGSQ